MKRTIAALALLTVAVLMGLGFVSVMQQMQRGQMDGCPFMPGEQAMCLMTALDHFNIWQQMLNAIFSVTPIVALIVIAQWAKQRVDGSSTFTAPRIAEIRRRTIGIPPPFLERLFSDGLLHPRIP